VEVLLLAPWPLLNRNPVLTIRTQLRSTQYSTFGGFAARRSRIQMSRPDARWVKGAKEETELGSWARKV